MNKLLLFYTVLLLLFAVYLAHIQETWFSVFVLGLSFLGYAMIIGTNKPLKDRPDEF